MKNSIFLGIFEGKDDIVEQFEISPSLLESVHIIFADYELEDDEEGEAFVLYEQEGELYEVHAFHCICDGVAGQWEPEVTDPATIHFRVQNSQTLKDNEDKLLDILKSVRWTTPWNRAI